MILVTGSTGLVGSHLLYELVKNNKKVKALVRNTQKIERVRKIFSYYSNHPDALLEKVEWVEGDILDPASYYDTLKNTDTVYHCAAMVSFDKKNKSELLKINIEGTANIVNACIEQNVSKLCFVSSVATLGGSQNGELIDEENRWSPTKHNSGYAYSKFKAEMEVWRGIQEGLDAVIVNPSVILGPGFWDSGSSSIFAKAAKGIQFYTLGSTGFVDVRDVVDAMIKLTESNIINQRFILNSENIVYKDLLEMICDAVSVKKPRINATKTMLAFASRMDWFLSILRVKKQEITKELAKSSLSRSEFSNQKIKQVLGKEFIPVEKTITGLAKRFKQDLTSN